MEEDQMMEPVTLPEDVAAVYSTLLSKEEALAAAADAFYAWQLSEYEKLRAAKRRMWQDMAEKSGLDLDEHTYVLTLGTDDSVVLSQES